jgi:hypothetical protein
MYRSMSQSRCAASRYLDLLDRARGEFFRHIGKPLAVLQREGTGFPVLECHLNQRTRRQLWEDLLLNLARDLVRDRPNRQEPRAAKRRPKPYPLLNQPRRRFVEISHRSRYWKGRPRNYRSLN